MPVLSLVLPFRGQRDINFALALATAIAERELRDSRKPGRTRIPALYKSGVRYKRDVCRAAHVPGACERFLSPRQLLKELRTGNRLGADCDDLAPWRAAEHRLKGVKAKAVAIRSPGIGYHVVVQLPDGRTEDPSRRLGMGRRKKRR